MIATALDWHSLPHVLAAALAIGAGVWAYAHWEDSPDGDSVVNAVRLAGVPVLDYFLGCGQ